jgi:hypothetical protein
MTFQYFQTLQNKCDTPLQIFNTFHICFRLLHYFQHFQLYLTLSPPPPLSLSLSRLTHGPPPSGGAAVFEAAGDGARRRRLARPLPGAQ